MVLKIMLVALLGGAVAVVAVALPDVKRYLRLRNM